jgi:hypothetical protein
MATQRPTLVASRLADFNHDVFLSKYKQMQNERLFAVSKRVYTLISLQLTRLYSLGIG